MINVVVLISGSGTNLQALIDAKQKGELPVNISAVISNRPAVKGLERAQLAGIETQVIDHTHFASRELFDSELQQRIDDYQPHLVVLAGFMRILTESFTRHYCARMLNIHPSLLPKYQGLNTHQRALEAGDSEHGVTVHFVTPELDGGPNVIQAVVPINSGDTVDSLAKKVQLQEHVIYPLAVNWFAQKRLSMDKHNSVLDNEVLPPSGYVLDTRMN
jgi:phosphoribosylglycinamide formyltransferase 1